MTELAENIKVKLFGRWLPDKPGGLNGLIELAAEVAAEAMAEGMGCGHGDEIHSLKARVEDLTEQLHFAEVAQVTEEDSIPELFVSYPCAKCGDRVHNTDSAIGQEHLQEYMRSQVEANVEPVAPGESAGK